MQQQQGGSRYGVPPPEMAAPLSSGAQAGPQQPRAIRIPGGVEYRQPPPQQTVPEEASPISSRPGPQQPAAPGPPALLFDEFRAGVGGVRGSFPDDEALGASEEAERAGGVGNRWPRQETLALLKIRSEMDAAFRDSPLKGPLWDDVSRKLAELGYARSAKKCKEKFENVHKYYKRTKEGRAGRQDGKSYRFFSQLEAIQSTNSVTTLATAVAAGAASTAPPLLTSSTMKVTAPPSGLKIQPVVFPSTGPVPLDGPALFPPAVERAPTTGAAGISFSSNTSSSSASDTDGDETEEGVAGAGVLQGGGRKRKREGWLIGSRKMRAFFDGLMKRVMERQEMMQRRFFETIEKRDQDRMIREEAWKRQEIARLNREFEMMAQERAMAASRDAAVISFLDKFTDFPATARPQTLPETAPPSSPPQHQTPPAPAAPVELQLHMPAMEFDSHDHERNELALTQLSVSPEPVSGAAAMTEAMGGGSLDIFSPSSLSLSSRWPKPEVLALIKLRSGLETRYLEAGPKGPLWEEISLGMKRLGYSRNPKRCKEKWENINKYFKKVKESNKKRSEDAKTCPYFHELDALYRKKQLGAATAAIAGVAAEQQLQLSVAKTNPQQHREPLRTLAAPPVAAPAQPDISNVQNKPTAVKSNIADGGTTHEMIAGDKVQRANGAGIPQVFFAGAPNRGGGNVMKKPEDFIRELMEQQNQPRQVANDYDKLRNPVDSDTMNHEYDDEDEDYDDEEEEEEENGKMQYEIQFQRQGVGSTAVGARAGNPTGKVATAASSAGSFLAMVQ